MNPVVLYVEDNAVNADLLMKRLRREGISMLLAENGTTGLEMAIHHRPGIIFLDINLPDISGIDLLVRLKQRKETAKIPVVMITADMSAETRHEATAKGCDGYLLKPVNKHMLLKLLQQLGGYQLPT